MHSLNSRSLFAGAFIPALAATAFAQSPSLEEKIAALEKANAAAQAAAAQAQMAGDNAWMLVSAALVLLMRGARVSASAIEQARREGLDEGSLGAL